MITEIIIDEYFCKYLICTCNRDEIYQGLGFFFLVSFFLQGVRTNQQIEVGDCFLMEAQKKNFIVMDEVPGGGDSTQALRVSWRVSPLVRVISKIFFKFMC